MPSNHLIFCHSLLLLTSIFPNIRVFSNESVLRMRWPKYWSFSFSFGISSSNEYSGLIFFQIDWFELLAVQGTLKSLMIHKINISKQGRNCRVFRSAKGYMLRIGLPTFSLTCFIFLLPSVSISSHPNSLCSSFKTLLRKVCTICNSVYIGLLYFSIKSFFCILNVFFNCSIIAGKESDVTKWLNNNIIVLQASLVAQMVKNPPAMKAT